MTFRLPSFASAARLASAACIALAARIALAALVALSLTACAAARPDDESADDLAKGSTLAPQGFVHGHTSATSPVSYTFTGSAGDTIAPDAWPTKGAKNGLQPVLQLFGPKDQNGKRTLVASGAPRDTAGLHQAISFKLPRAGSYQLTVSAQTGHPGDFSLRFWSSASHAPRPEAAQLDLQLRVSPATAAAVSAHSANGSRAGKAWTDAEIAGITSAALAQKDFAIGFSDLQQLFLALSGARSDGLASAEQVARSKAALVQVVGGAARFHALTGLQQSLALYWAGQVTQAVFTGSELSRGQMPTRQRAQVDQKIGDLLGSWRGAVEEGQNRHVVAFSANDTTYGFVAAWACDQLDTDGSPVWSWFSTDYFNQDGSWLGQTSAGATESEDD